MRTTHFPDDLRGLLWRGGRGLYAWARNDGGNDPRTNGEYWLLRRVVARAKAPMVLVDVGANRGDWTVVALASAVRPGDVRIHAFEPAADPRRLLLDRLWRDPNVVIHSEAIGDSEGDAAFFTGSDALRGGSLAPLPGRHSEQVRTITLDAFATRERLRHITMVKVGAGGFDFDVMAGARELLEMGAIDILQFDYDWRWLPNRRSLWDVFEKITTPGYQLGKLTAGAICVHEDWHPELDRFFESNYALVRKGSPFESLTEPFEFDRRDTLRRARR